MRKPGIVEATVIPTGAPRKRTIELIMMLDESVAHRPEKRRTEVVARKKRPKTA